MKKFYQCKVCLETFSLLRYLRKHVTTPAVGEHQPNKCQSYYSGTGNLQENLKVHHKIVPENNPTQEFNCKPKGQRVQLISANNQEKGWHSKDDDDDCRIIEDEPACLKFEPDEEDELYFFDRESPILPCNDIANTSPQRFLNNEDQTKEDNLESNFIEDEKRDQEIIKQAIIKHHNIRTREIGIDILGLNRTKINSPVEITICKKCKLNCTSLENLCIHYETLHKLPVVVLARVITNQKNPKYKRTEARNSNEAIRQTRTHQCGICSKRLATLNSLKQHKSSIHDGKRLNCNVCRKTFKWLDSLKRHKLSAHDGFRYTCNICARKFSQVSQLNRHKSSIHDNVKFRCDICQKEFNRLDNLKTHKLNRHEPAVYKCNNCPRQFHTSKGFSLHKASVHNGIRYMCELCDKQFMQKQSLREHKAIRHDGVRHKCDTCPKEYSYVEDLRRHKSVTHPTELCRDST